MSKEMQTTATLNSDRNSNTTAETPETENEKEESKNPTGLWTDLFKFKTSKTANSVWFGALWSGCLGGWRPWWSNTWDTNLDLETFCPYLFLWNEPLLLCNSFSLQWLWFILLLWCVYYFRLLFISQLFMDRRKSLFELTTLRKWYWLWLC